MGTLRVTVLFLLAFVVMSGDGDDDVLDMVDLDGVAVIAAEEEEEEEEELAETGQGSQSVKE